MKQYNCKACKVSYNQLALVKAHIAASHKLPTKPKADPKTEKTKQVIKKTAVVTTGVKRQAAESAENLNDDEEAIDAHRVIESFILH